MKFEALFSSVAVQGFFTQATKTATCVAACNAVARLYPSQVASPSSSAFLGAQDSYWNAPQQKTTPACFFQPTSADQVQTAIVEVVQAKCPFSIKGGGHSSNLGGSSIQDGFQFDLVNLNHNEITSDRRAIKLGPGNQWGPLFPFLEEQGLIALGGRDSGVGVPGFLFGGGISYFATQRGWAVDQLISTDLVLANGTLITVNSTSHTDLNKALRGGGASNFGIVTSFEVNLYPYNGMWGGVHVVTEEHFDAVFDAYDVFTHGLAEDGKAHLLMDFARVNGTLIVAQFMSYPEPVQDPPVFDSFRPIPAAMDTLRLTNYSDLAIEMAQITDTRGKRNTYWTRAFKYDIDLLKSIYKVWVTTSESYADRLLAALDVQLIMPQMRKAASSSGVGNVLGLEDSDEILQLIVLSIIWENETDDEEVMDIIRQLDADIEVLVQQRGKHHDFKYMNYGHTEQDVIGSYGQKNKAFLKEVAAKYDPMGVFQKLQPGGFKLDGPDYLVPGLIEQARSWVGLGKAAKSDHNEL
ncbi:hypothetical protein NW759_016922 [Fusarium solani]|nr:hypothetical protein NW759_016922 [Fusarium solani]